VRKQLKSVGVALATAAVYAGGATASPIRYFDRMEFQQIDIGGTHYGCTSVTDGSCAFIAITGLADTRTVTAFSVPGALGFKNVLTSAHLSVFFLDSSLAAIEADIDLGVGGLYVSVDQTNSGAGFGSSYGPTYPLATYGGGLGHYDLASDIFASGFGPFCTSITLCDSGEPLRTVDGAAFTITRGRAPAYSSFSSTVLPDPVPEPGSGALVALGLAALAWPRRTRPAAAAR